MARILQTGTPPKDIEAYLKRGVIDASPGKLDFLTVPAFAKAYLVRNHLAKIISEV
jgi:hypothetical protein